MLSASRCNLLRLDIITSHINIMRFAIFWHYFTASGIKIYKMKGKVTCIVLSLAAVGALGGSFYSEKESAIQAVNEKFEGLKKIMTDVSKHVEDEKKKTETEIEKQVRDTSDMANQKTLKQFAAEISSATRSAIAKGKPLSVIDCISKVAFEGREAIIKVKENIQNELENIKSRKKAALDMLQFQINLIGTSIQELKEESIKKINEAKAGFQALQADAIKKIDNAKKQVEEVEALVSKPDLKSEFLALKRQVEAKYQEVLVTYVKKIQKC